MWMVGRVVWIFGVLYWRGLTLLRMEMVEEVEGVVVARLREMW